MQGERQIALLGSHDVHFLEVDRRPVTHAIAYHIYKGVGQGYEPNPFVLENIVNEKSLERNLLFLTFLAFHS